MSKFRRDFETVDEAKARQERDPLMVETDIGKVLDALPPPMLFDMGPRWNSPAMERAVIAEEERITRLDNRDKGR
jgi:hypothetical protein